MTGPTEEDALEDYPGAPATPHADDQLTDDDLGIVSGGGYF